VPLISLSRRRHGDTADNDDVILVAVAVAAVAAAVDDENDDDDIGTENDPTKDGAASSGTFIVTKHRLMLAVSIVIVNAIVLPINDLAIITITVLRVYGLKQTSMQIR